MNSDSLQIRPVKPVLMAYLRQAQLLMTSGSVPDTRTVHDVRVLMKKARSALRLMEPQLVNEKPERDDIALREVGRLLRHWRDAAILRKILKELKEDHPRIFRQLEANEIILAILAKPEKMNQPDEVQRSDINLIQEYLRKTSSRIRFMSTSSTDPDKVISELEKNYTAVRQLYLICRFKPSGKKLHRFRKKLKNLLYQLSFVRPADLSGIKALEKKMDTLAGCLGKYHDLSLLTGSIGYNVDDAGKNPGLDELMLRIRERQDKIIGKMWQGAMKLFTQPHLFQNIKNQ